MNNIEALEVQEAIEKGFLRLLCNGMFHCNCCGCPISGEMQAIAHIRGTKHLKKLRQSEQVHGQVSPSFEVPAKKLCQEVKNNNHLETEECRSSSVQNSGFFCDVCQIGLNGRSQYDLHLSGKNHAKKLKTMHSANLLEGNSEASSSRSSSCSPPPNVKVHVSVNSNSLISSVPKASSKSHLNTESELDDTNSSVISLTEFNNKIRLYDREDVFKDNLIVVGVNEPIPEFFKSY
ncbi:UNVERIFIED_CONTAM: hypothetical protein RMT77_009765 [Armadillidium vulgare]